MAYMFAIQTACQWERCKRPRTHRVCNHINDTMGDYCEAHAEARLKSLQETEAKLFAKSAKDRS